MADEADLGIVDGLLQLSLLVQAELARIAAEREMSIIQLRLLSVLRDRTPAMHALARHLGLDKSSMTGLVDRAERRGLVQRSATPHDGRVVQVSLTAPGRELVREAEAEVERRIGALTAVLTDAQRTQLSRTATILVRGAPPSRAAVGERPSDDSDRRQHAHDPDQDRRGEQRSGQAEA